MTPTQRTRAYLKEKGYLSHITEKWNSHAKKRQDMFGFIDLVYLDPFVECIIAVQMTSGANHAARKTKIATECAKQASMWFKCGGGIEIWSWSKRRSNAKTKTGRRSKVMLWTKRVEELQPSDLISP